MAKGKPLTMAMLELEPKGGSMSDAEESEDTESEDGAPLGLEAAISEFRQALASEDDKAAGEAFHRAMKCCD